MSTRNAYHTLQLADRVTISLPHWVSYVALLADETLAGHEGARPPYAGIMDRRCHGRHLLSASFMAPELEATVELLSIGMFFVQEPINIVGRRWSLEHQLNRFAVTMENALAAHYRRSERLSISARETGGQYPTCDFAARGELADGRREYYRWVGIYRPDGFLEFFIICPEAKHELWRGDIDAIVNSIAIRSEP